MKGDNGRSGNQYNQEEVMSKKLEYCDICDEYVTITDDGELSCGHYDDQIIEEEHYMMELNFHEYD